MAGFSFGSAAVNPAPAAPAPAAGGFSFGNSGAKSEPAPAPGGFSFGGAASTTPATTATAPATGFSFASAPSTSTTTTTPASAPSSGFSFGGSTPAPGTTPSTTGTTTAAPSSSAPTSGGGEVVMIIPSFESIFPYLSLNRRIRKVCDMLQDETKTTEAERLLQGHELREILKEYSSTLLPNSQTILRNENVQPNTTLRQKLATPNAIVHLHGKPTGLTQSILQDIINLADELHLEESHAATLYAGASDASTRAWLENNLETSFCHYALNNQKKALEPLSLSSVNHAAKEIYFYERSCCLSTILLLLQHRVHASSVLSSNKNEEEDGRIFAARTIIESTDQFLLTQHDLINCIMKFIREVALKCERSVSMITNAILAAESYPSNNNNMFATSSSQTNTSPTTNTVNDIEYAFMNFSFQQRQLASECVFYLSYSTQFQASEVASLIDLMKDLTNDDTTGGIGYGLPQLDPLKDVPDPYLAPSNYNTNSTPNFNQQQQSQQYPAVKSNRQWQEELIASLWTIPGMTNVSTLTGTDYTGNWIMSKASKVPGGRPQLLQSVSVLVLAGICCLDTKCLLLDRNTHTFNSFGEGNALCQKSSSSKATIIEDIHSRLDPNGESFASWNRQDIVGLLSAAYGLLLRPTASTLNSPQQSPYASIPSPSIRDPNMDIKATFRSCLEIPTVNKSLTFARCTLLPSLGCTSRCNTVSFGNKLDSDYAFFMSVLSTFSASYIDLICTFGELPISRAQWLSDEEKELQVRHVQEEQRRQFGAWSGQTYTSPTSLPTEVDIMKRPDCIDDVIALAISICTSCPDCASQFWSIISDECETNCVQLEPSKVVQKLERLQSVDISILPSYFSFLAALSLTEAPDKSEKSLNGATVVYRFLASIENSSLTPGANAHNNITWYYVLNALRRYADELSENSENTASMSSSAQSTVGGIGRSTNAGSNDFSSYYYGTDNYGEPGNDDMNLSGNIRASRNGDTSSANLNQSTNGVRQKSKELGELDKSILHSLLILLSNVCFKSSEARSEILEMKILLSKNKQISIGQEDDALSILFSLLGTDVDPDIRGSIFVAIANLLRSEDLVNLTEGQKKKILENGEKGWQMLDASQIIPISLLEQYTHIQSDAISSLPRDYRSSSFFTNQNQSSYQNHSTTSSNWFPPSKQYGILYEMEHVESRNGCYPSTEGLLFLLTTLFSNVGSPPNLGFKHRPRPGCSPYIEYVTDFVMQRILGTKRNDDGLFFATPADRCRLLSRALEVIDAVLYRYIVPPPSNVDGTTKNARKRDEKFDLLSHGINEDKSESEGMNNIMKYHESIISSASEQIGLSLVCPFIFIPTEKIEFSVEEILTNRLDYSNEYVKAQTGNQNNTQTNRNFQTDEVDTNMFFDATATENSTSFSMNQPQSTPTESMNLSIPRTKSPGFYVLSDLLSSSENSLFHLLSKILLENENTRGIHVLYGDAVHSKSLALALYGDLMPSHELAKTGRDHLLYQQKVHIDALQISSMNSSFIQTSMQSLYSSRLHGFYESTLQGKELFLASKDDAIFWRERNILLALRLLCLAIGREDSFIQATNLSSSFNIIPVIHFKQQTSGSVLKSGLEVKHLKNSRISKLITGASGPSAITRQSMGLAPVLAQYVGYQALSDENDQNIANFALSVMMYLTRVLPQCEYVRLLCGNSMVQQKYISKSIATRLSLPSNNSLIANKFNARHVIMDLLLSNISQQESVGDGNLSHILLGLSGENLLKEKANLQSMAKTNFNVESGLNTNCLESILDMISDMNFVLDAATSRLASKCYELIYRLCKFCHYVGESDTTARLIRRIVIEKLRSNDFWVIHLDRFLSETSNSSKSLLHLLVASLSSNEDTYLEDPMSFRRNHDILHCVSWLLRGLSVELHSLLALDTSRAPLSLTNPYTSAPKNSQCRRLVDFLYGKNYSFLQKILLAIPLTTPNVANRLNEVPAQELIQSTSCSLDGPIDVCGGYKVVNLSVLRSRVNNSVGATTNASSSYNEGTLKWAGAWNAYVSYVCAASHLSSSFNDVLRTSTLCCRPLLFDVNKLSSGDITGTNGMFEILQTILYRLNKPSGKEFTNPILDSSGDLEASIALPLSMSVLNLIGVISDINSDLQVDGNLSSSRRQRDQGKKCHSDVEEIVRIAELMMGAIEVCSHGGRSVKAHHDERAASLSLSLSMIFSRDCLLAGYIPLPLNLFQSLRSRAIHAGRHLAKLAGLSICGDDFLDSLKSTGISLAARSGLSAILTFFHSQSLHEEHSVIGPNFLTEIFSDKIVATKSNCNLRRLTHLLASFDTDIHSTLETIVSCEHGAELIYHAGATEALISSAKQYINEIKMSSGATGMERENYGSIMIDSPNFLKGHLSLLISMISANSDDSVKQSILIDAARFLRVYVPLLEKLITSYPKDCQTAIQFIKCAYMTSSGLNRYSRGLDSTAWTLQHPKDCTNDFSGVFGKELCNRLEQRICDLVYHLAEFPFPSTFLPSLPPQLRAIRRSQLSKMKYGSAKIRDGRSWWDLLKYVVDNTTSTAYCNPVTVLPDPPTGSFDANSSDNYSMMLGRPERGSSSWSDEHYYHASASATCLEYCLMFLCSQISGQESNLNLDSLSLSIGICRCADASRAIQDRLKNMKLSEERQMSSLFSQASLNSRNSNEISSQIKIIEKKALDSLGPKLGRCTENLLYLSYLNTHRILSDNSNNMYSEIRETILPALEHTQIETMGIGCTGTQDSSKLEGHDNSVMLAEKLRKLLQTDQLRTH